MALPHGQSKVPRGANITLAKKYNQVLKTWGENDFEVKHANTREEAKSEQLKARVDNDQEAFQRRT